MAEAQQTTPRRVFRSSKYAAFNLLIARWLRGLSEPTEPYYYVTLGGTELYDITNISWIDARLVTAVRSYEEDRQRFGLATTKSRSILSRGINVQVIQNDIFAYTREFNGKHLYFLDFEKTCAGDQCCMSFSQWFEADTVLPGDCLLITSYLGRNPGWERVLTPFEGEFRSLRVNLIDQQMKLYKIAHPLFLLYRALREAGRDDSLKLNCIGLVKYFDTSSMGLYAFSCEAGRCDFGDSVNSLSVFDSVKREWNNNWRRVVGIE
jgi:hypothetical protein